MKPLYTQEEFDKAKGKDLLALECKHCSKTFYKTKTKITGVIRGYYTDGNFCSNECYCNSPFSKITCEICNRQIKVSNIGKHIKACNGKKEKTENIPPIEIVDGKGKCPFCNKEYLEKGIRTHIWRNHTEDGKLFSPNTGYIKGTRIAWNKGLTKETDERIKKASETLSNKYKSGEITSALKGTHLSEEAKKNLSDIIKLRYKNDPSLFYKLLNKNKISAPCQYVKEYLTKNNLKFIEEYPPIKERMFSIDIAFPDKMIGIEINGTQHYNKDGNLKEYYQKRHDLIVESGWVLLEIPYNNCFNDGCLKSIIDFVNNVDVTCVFNYEAFIPRIKKDRRKFGTREMFNKYQKELWLTNQKDNIDKISSSNIDFSKHGWVQKAALILEISSQKVNRWFKKAMPDFYQERCFKKIIL